MPAENAARANNLDLKNGQKKYFSNENQLKKLGLAIDWEREISNFLRIIINTNKIFSRTI